MALSVESPDATNEGQEQELRALLAEGVAAGVFPGAVAVVSSLTEGSAVRSLRACAGRLAPDEAAVELATPYDLASLTKPFVAVAALRLAQQRRVDLSLPVSYWLSELEGTAGGESSLAQLLSHRAGLAAWASLYLETREPPGSIGARQFILREAATRVAAVERGGSLYSDFGYIVAGEALARAAGRALSELVRREVTEPLGLSAQLFYAAALDEPARSELRARVAPTEYSPVRGGALRGDVHDENCQALGGVSGHAGMFGTAEGVAQFGLAILKALEGRSSFLDQALVRWALAARGAGYVVGWDRKSEHGSSAGALFSPHSFGHLGFTGTSIWCDPSRRSCAVLLSNRVHPTRDNLAIRAFRPRFHDHVAQLGS